MADEIRQTNWLDVLQGAMWPAIVLLGLCIFASPVRSLILTIGHGVGPAQEFEVGPLKIKLSERALKDIDPPSVEVAEALASLSPSDLERLLVRAENTSIVVCMTDKPMHKGNADPEETIAYRRMSELGLMNISPAMTPSYDWCPLKQTKSVGLSDKGVMARRYIFQVTTRALSITSTAAPEK